MNCELADRLLDHYLENELGQRDRHLLEKHLAGCRHCAGELRRRPAFERDVRRTLAASVAPLTLSSDASLRIVKAAEQSWRRAVWSHRVMVTFQLVSGTVVAALLVVGLLAWLGQIPVPAHLTPTALFPTTRLPLSPSYPDRVSSRMDVGPRLDATTVNQLPRASFRIEPRDLHARQPFTMTVFLDSDLPEPLERLRLNLDVSGPTGSYGFGWLVIGPVPANGVSKFRVTPDLLAEPCQRQYLISPEDIFSLPGVYTVQLSLFEPVVASK